MQQFVIDTLWGDVSLILHRQVSASKLQDCLTDDERAECVRYKSTSQQVFHRNARILTRQALADYTGTAPEYLQIARHCRACGTEGHGKPYLSDGTKLQFNVSHSGDTLVIAMTRDQQIGVDVEYGEVTTDVLDRLGLGFTSNERPAARWVRMEASLKALGWGLGAFGKIPDIEARIQQETQSVVLKEILDVPIGVAWTRSSVDTLASQGPIGMRQIV